MKIVAKNFFNIFPDKCKCTSCKNRHQYFERRASGALIYSQMTLWK